MKNYILVGNHSVGKVLYSIKKDISIILGIITVFVCFFAFSSLVSAENIPPSLIVTKTISPNEVLQGATTTITFNLSATGTPRQNLDVMLLMDKSASMLGDKITEAKSAASSFIDNLNSEYDRAGLVGFSYYVAREDLCCGYGCGPSFEEAQLLEGLTTDFDQVKNTLNALVPDSGTNTGDAINKGNTELSSSSADVKVEILLSDGQPNFPVEYECVDCGENGYQFMIVDESLPISYALAQAQEAKNNGIIIFTISLGDDADQEFMKAIASTTGGTHYYAPSASDLNDIFLSIAGALNNLIGNNIVITDVISAGVDLDSQSLPEGCTYEINENKTTTVTCPVGSMSIGDPDKSVSFTVIPNDSSLTTINDSAQVDYDTFDKIFIRS